MIRRATLVSNNGGASSEAPKDSYPQSIEEKSKKGRKFRLQSLKFHIICVSLLSLSFFFSSVTEFFANGESDYVEAIDHSITSIKVEVENDEQKEPEFDRKLAKKIVAAGLGKLDVLKPPELVERRKTTAISLVISHCEHKLHWIPKYLGKDYTIKDIVIYSKCGKEVKGLSGLAELAHVQVVRLENVGRCDHTYANWIHEHYYKYNKQKDGDDIVLFLKDNKRFYPSFRGIHEVFTHATETGFACVKKPQCDCYKPCNLRKYDPLMMHEKKQLTSFAINDYSRMERDENSSFLSEKYPDMKSWMDDMGFQIPNSETLPVCYLGMFAAKKKQILNQPVEAWERMTNSLARANNLIEGHYAERIWASLLSTHDERYLQEIEKVLLPKVKRVVKQPKDGAVCGMIGMYYVKRGETFESYI